MKPFKEIIFALSTQRGKSGIAVFRVSGKGSHKIIKSISSKKKFKMEKMRQKQLMEEEFTHLNKTRVRMEI